MLGAALFILMHYRTSMSKKFTQKEVLLVTWHTGLSGACSARIRLPGTGSTPSFKALGDCIISWCNINSIIIILRQFNPKLERWHAFGKILELTAVFLQDIPHCSEQWITCPIQFTLSAAEVKPSQCCPGQDCSLDFLLQPASHFLSLKTLMNLTCDVTLPLVVYVNLCAPLFSCQLVLLHCGPLFAHFSLCFHCLCLCVVDLACGLWISAWALLDLFGCFRLAT